MTPGLVFLKFTDPSVIRAWKSMETPSMSPFLHYDYMYYVYRYIRRAKPYRPRVACVMDGDEPLMLVALLGSLDGKYWKMMGDIQGSGCADALWKPSLPEDERRKTAEFFFSSIGRRLKLHRIREGSPLLDALPGRATPVHTEPCVRILLQGDAGAHIAGLSSSVRQNIRTAFNRMKRDGLDWRLEIFDGSNPMTDKVWNAVMELYFQRLFSKYKQNKVRSFLSRWHQRHKYFHVKHDTISLRRLPNSLHAVLWNGDRIMAFCSGLTSHDGSTLSVPRLAINDSFRFYSPGYVLIKEMLEFMASGSTLRELDLSRGDEKYKTDLGGVLYSTFDYDLR